MAVSAGNTQQNFESAHALTTAIAAAENNTTWAAGQNKITVTNDLPTISPTGLVLRYAPYVLILIGGIVLLIISKKHRKHTEED